MQANLIDKLSKLDGTQQSIETLSHWCIFHRKNAKQVVEVWEREFFRAHRSKRIPFLFLANDILQNSRKKGSEFVNEFSAVISGALKDAMDNGDEETRKKVLRLLQIWEERRVFGSFSQELRAEVLGQPGKNTQGILPEKLVAVYKAFQDKLLDDDAVIEKSNNAVMNMEALEKEIEAGQEGSGLLEELQNQENLLLECTDRLEANEAAYLSIIFQLKETLREQEEKLERTRLLLQATRSRVDQSRVLQQQIYEATAVQGYDEPAVPNSSDENSLLSHFTTSGPGVSFSPLVFSSGEAESYVPSEVRPFETIPTMANAAPKLVVSSSMISSVLSSLAAENVLQSLTAPPLSAPALVSESGEPETKRQKLEHDGEGSHEGDPEEELLVDEVDGQDVDKSTETAVATVAEVTGINTATNTVLSTPTPTSTAAATATTTSSTVAQYLESSLLLPYNFAGQFGSSAAPSCPAEYHPQNNSASALTSLFSSTLPETMRGR